MQKLRSFLSKKVLIYGVVLLLAIGGGVAIFGNGEEKQIVKVVVGEVVQEVAATGKVKPAESVEMGFGESGRIGVVYGRVGDQVYKGQVIAALESGALRADLNKANAQLLEEQIKLRELRNTAPISFGDANKNLAASIQEGFASADNAVRNKIDQFFIDVPENPRFEVSIESGGFIHYFNVKSDLKLELNNSRKQIEIILDSWQSRNIKLDQTNLVGAADQAITDLKQIAIFLDKVASAVNSFEASDYDYQTTVAGYKTDVNVARGAVSTAISDLVTAKDKLNTAPTLGNSGEFESILSQEAKVRQAEANLAAYNASLGETVIRAPFDGVITVQDAKVGSTVSPGVALVSMISQNSMYIEANISEIGIGKISVGNPVTVSFDAFPGEEYRAFVSYIEPGDFVLDGVVNYKIRVELGEVSTTPDGNLIMDFVEVDPKIKSGLTANLRIETAKKAGVLSLPSYALLREPAGTFVNKIIDKNKSTKVPVSIGISGNNGLVEILSGLEVGDQIEF